MALASDFYSLSFDVHNGAAGEGLTGVVHDAYYVAGSDAVDSSTADAV